MEKMISTPMRHDLDSGIRIAKHLVRSARSGRQLRNKALRRFLRYTLVGGSTFALDLGMLFAFTDGLGVSPVTAAGVAFIIAVSINYIISRRFVFAGTKRTLHGGYVGFLLIAGCGVLFVTGGMHVLVTELMWPYMLSRVLVACMTGLWNYLLNLYVNFNVAGKHV